jgi:UPF0716 family protein affecting phage T7 exclusion
MANLICVKSHVATALSHSQQKDMLHCSTLPVKAMVPETHRLLQGILLASPGIASLLAAMVLLAAASPSLCQICHYPADLSKTGNTSVTDGDIALHCY